MLSHATMLKLWHKRNRGSKSLGHGFSTIHDIIVDRATACATMATHWVFGEFDAELYGDVKSIARREIGGQNLLSIFCPLVHVLPCAPLSNSKLRISLAAKISMQLIARLQCSVTVVLLFQSTTN